MSRPSLEHLPNSPPIMIPLIKGLHIHSQNCRHLRDQRLGPFQALEKAGLKSYRLRKKERKKSLARGHVKDIGSAGVYSPIGGRGTKGLYPGSAFVPSRYLHLYVMVVLSGARVVRAL